ncbi:MAG: hypothetical protein CSA09_01080 [Candidatus Contendobacter odensis]|uniref:DUF2069 domain-containing protein n=1 Tax=Candidatus Contendibacter odensensis TaxID=1400860 RepID=A0A2G6PH38_9GAMM|nr:MAG: hypothetical protein CSA09_01080 [Candidatus Contendobacter odensis]
MSLFWYVVALISYLGLFSTLMLWFSWLEPAAQWPVSLVLIVLVGPLLTPLRGLLHGRTYTFAWASFLALFYFLVGAFNASGPMVHTWLAWSVIACSILLFLGTIMYVREYGREQRNKPDPQPLSVDT